MSTKPESSLYALVGKRVLIRNTTMVPRLIRGYSGVATDVYMRDDQVPFYRVQLDAVQAKGGMTDIVKRLNEECNGQNGEYLVQAADVVQDPTPTDMYWRYQYMPSSMATLNEAEMAAASAEVVEYVWRFRH
jgi:hypothetical protein